MGQRTYRLLYNLFAVVSFLPILALAAMLPDQRLYAIPSPWVVISLAGQVLAVLALLAGVLQTGVWAFLGVQQLLQPASDQPPRLVVRGLYRWVRHPLYTAGLSTGSRR
jgi:protein-S-isoprenylcysteine O-methyltransferase Ste14